MIEFYDIDENYINFLKTFDKQVPNVTYCNANIQSIQNKALSVYRIGCDKNHVLNHVCCDFKKLEEHYLEYIKT